MRHRRLDNRLVWIVGCHRDDAAKHFKCSAVPIFDDIVKRGKTAIDERVQIFANRFASVPIGNTEMTDGVFRKAVKPLPNVLSSISFHIASVPSHK